MARDITTVIEQIKKEVPEDWGKNVYWRESFFRSLDNIPDMRMVQHPYDPSGEIEFFWALRGTLFTYLSDPDTPWKQRIADIMAGRVNEPVKDCGHQISCMCGHRRKR